MNEMPLIMILVQTLLFSSCSFQSDLVHDSFPSLASLNVSYLKCNLYGPFSKDDPNPTIEMSYQSPVSDIYEYIVISEIGSSSPLYRKTITNHTIDSSGRINFSFVLPLDDYFLDSGIRLCFNFASRSMQYDSYGIYTEFYPKKKVFINSAQTKTYSISDTMFKFPYSVNAVTEKYDFNDTVSTFQNKDYFTLPLTGISFKYTLTNEKFTCKDCYLTTDNPYGFFNNCMKDGIVKIPLKCSYSSSKVTFSYKNSMYVNNDTFFMSLSSLYNHQQTNNFYLPRNKGKEMDDTKFTIVMEGCGRNDTTINIPLTYYSLRNHFGSCSDSDYCIRGGISG